MNKEKLERLTGKKVYTTKEIKNYYEVIEKGYDYIKVKDRKGFIFALTYIVVGKSKYYFNIERI